MPPPLAPAGRKYEGQFKLGHRTGKGIFTSANGKKLKGGIWENGELVVRAPVTSAPVRPACPARTLQRLERVSCSSDCGFVQAVAEK